MGRKVYTREIMEALDIPAAPVTADTILELEQAIEKRWLEAFEEQRIEMEAVFRKRQAFDDAYVRIAQAVLSELHNQGVVIPTLYTQAALEKGEPDEEVVTQLMDHALHYTTEGRNFEILKQAIMGNETLKSEWERFCMFLRLAED